MIRFPRLIAAVSPCFLLLPLAGGGETNAPPVTTGTLIREMADLEGLTRFPGPGVRVVQFSSYDRRSSVPGGPDWFANSDGFGGESIPGFEGVAKEPGADGVGEYVICDVQRPGAIVRTWTAAIGGKLRVTLDGADKPLYEGPAEEFLMHKASVLARAGGVDPKADPHRVSAFEQRYADYFPIPFAKSCRVVWIGKLSEVHFYHVQVREYPAGTAVETYDVNDPKKWHTTAVDTGKLLADHRGGGGEPGAIEHQVVAKVKVVPGQFGPCANLEGQGQITRLEVKVSAADIPAALRGTVLRACFDGSQTPQIAAPIGDFFGAAPGIVPYDTLPMSVKEDGTMVCRFVMPYARSAVITAENRTEAPVEISITTTHGAYEWNDRSMHMHAHWQVDHDLVARGGANAVDLPFLSAHGEGTYVGSAVYIMSPCPVPTAGGNWWGEGDEKVFVDGEARPSIFGTGSEDYFNYAWSESDIFQYPYFSQPICTGPETRGYITNNRWHVLDAIPFDRSISFAMELLAHTPTPHLSYARIAYWYGRPGAYADVSAINDSDLRVPPLPAWTVRAAGGAAGATIFEGETARDPASPGLVVEDVRYSGGKLARFTGPSGALRVQAEKAGKYRIVLTCTSGPEKATFSAKIDGTPLVREGSATFELQTPHVERLVNVRCDTVELSRGEHTLTLSGIQGSVGVDFVWLKPVEN